MANPEKKNKRLTAEEKAKKQEEKLAKLKRRYENMQEEINSAREVAKYEARFGGYAAMQQQRLTLGFELWKLGATDNKVKEFIKNYLYQKISDSSKEKIDAYIKNI